MPKTTVISVRVPASVKEEIEKLGFDVSTFVKEAIYEAIQRKRAELALKWITSHRVPGKKIGFDSVEVIRQTREIR
jgi:post-segregation antitoxin (ccd killing protein)